MMSFRCKNRINNTKAMQAVILMDEVYYIPWVGGWFGFTKKQKGMIHPNIYGYHGEGIVTYYPFFHGGELNHE